MLPLDSTTMAGDLILAIVACCHSRDLDWRPLGMEVGHLHRSLQIHFPWIHKLLAAQSG